MPFREIFEQVLKESEARLNEDKRGKKMTEVPLKQHFLNSKFDDGRKMFDSPEDLIAATVRTASGKYGIVRSVSKELDAEGFPLKVVITADEDTPIKRGIEVSTEGMLAPREVRVATVDMNDETTKRVTGLINAGKSDDEIINDLFDPAQYQHSPENEQQVRDLLASVRSTLPKEEQSPSAKLLAQIKNRAVELGKANNIPVEDYIKSLDRADFLASAYDDITDEELVDDIKFFNEEAQKPNGPEEEIKEPAEGEEIDWGKELGESTKKQVWGEFIKENMGIDPHMLIMAGHNPNNVSYVWYYDEKSKQIVGSDKVGSHDDPIFSKIASKKDAIRGRVFTLQNKTFLIIYGEVAGKRNPTDEEVRDIYLKVSKSYPKNIDYVVNELGEEMKITESKLNEIRYQVIIPGLNDMGSMKDQRETSASSEKQAVANIISRLARNSKGLVYKGINVSPQNIGLLISKVQAKVTKLSESKLTEIKCTLCGENTPITKDLEDASKAICGPCEKEEKMAKLTVEGKTQDAYDRLQVQLKTEKDEVKRRQLQDEISDIEDHWKQTWEAKDPGMSFHYLVGSIKGLLQSWSMIEHMESPLNYIKERLEALYKEMNESKMSDLDIEMKELKKDLHAAYAKGDKKAVADIQDRIDGLSKKVKESKEKPYLVKYGNNSKSFATKEEAETFKASLSEEWEVTILKESKINEDKCEKCGKEPKSLTHEDNKWICPNCKPKHPKKEHTVESKVNEDEVLAGNNSTTPAPTPAPEEETASTPEEPVAAEPVAEEPKKVEDKPTKQYLGNNGSSDYFYFLEVMGNDGTVTELQVTDAEEKVIYTTKDSDMDINDVAGFINAAIKAKEIANISTDILTKYLMPEETPKAEVAEEEEKIVPEQEPKMESLMKKYNLIEKVNYLLDQEYPKEADVYINGEKSTALGRKHVIVRVDGKNESMSNLMEKYNLNEEEEEVIEEEPVVTEEVPLEEPIGGEVPVEEPVVGGPAEKPIVSPVPEEEGIEVPVEEPKTAEEAKTKIMLEYPEEPFTSLAIAFADSLTNDPKVYGPVRQLQYEGQWVNADDFTKMAKVVGELNGFNGTETAKKLADKFGGDSSKYRIGRNNFVVVDIVVRDMSAAHSLEAVKDLVGASAAEDMGEGMVRIQFGRKG